MATNIRQGELESLEQDRVALENATSQPEIAKELEDVGYTQEVIAGGKQIYTETREAYDFKKIEDDETTEAKAKLDTNFELLKKTYGTHRKKGKIVFKESPVVLKKLELTGEKPRNYIGLIDTAKVFYTTALADNDIINNLRRLKVTPEDLTKGKELVQEVEANRAFYLKEKGESQDATDKKDAAFRKLDRWMSDFYSIARIALEDKPQLLETLGITVKS